MTNSFALRLRGHPPRTVISEATDRAIGVAPFADVCGLRFAALAALAAGRPPTENDRARCGRLEGWLEEDSSQFTIEVLDARGA